MSSDVSSAKVLAVLGTNNVTLIAKAVFWLCGQVESGRARAPKTREGGVLDMVQG